MQTDSFAVGDVVILKSGGPATTVTGIGKEQSEGVVYCSWFDALNKVSANFPAGALKKLEEGQY